MGAGIGQLAAMSGLEVTLYDVDNEALMPPDESIARSLERFVAKAVLTSAEAADVVERIAMRYRLGASGKALPSSSRQSPRSWP